MITSKFRQLDGDLEMSKEKFWHGVRGRIMKNNSQGKSHEWDESIKSLRKIMFRVLCYTLGNL
jgi:hypothetical protein